MMPLRAETGEPAFHSDITDQLPTTHPNAHSNLYCTCCSEMVHAGNNECMQPWFETNSGPYCTTCFLKQYDEREANQLGLETTMGLDQHTTTEHACPVTKRRPDGVLLHCCRTAGHGGVGPDHWWYDPRLTFSQHGYWVATPVTASRGTQG